MTTTHRPATDLGFLLHKHPGKAQSFSVASGTAHVFYPRADERECTAALLLEVDPIGLVRGRRHDAFTLGQYVNDRPYTAGSLLAVALGVVFRTAMNGRCDARRELADSAIPLRVHLPALPCDGGPELLERLFAPLGWHVRARPVPLSAEVPEWGDSRCCDVELTGELRLSDALRHLYVLLPVADDAKHYWVEQQEVDKLLRAGEGWLAAHPERELITSRYLKRAAPLVRSALSRLAEGDDPAEGELDDALTPPRISLAEQRRHAVLAVLRELGARRVLDLGCGGGALLRDLLDDPSFTHVLGVDVSAGALAAAHARLGLDRLPDRVRERISLRQSALTYTDPSLAGYDAAVLVEVVEHVEPDRLPALERAVFEVAAPGAVVVTTPNAEHNVLFETLPAGQPRHADHRFEWTRAEFARWADGVAARHGLRVRYLPVGPDDPVHGPPTQMAVFTPEEAR
jgi:3' terminal RNA ribose 2'-O-methyltransferase Hen1